MSYNYGTDEYDIQYGATVVKTNQFPDSQPGTPCYE